jgi:hypothetical protein
MLIIVATIAAVGVALAFVLQQLHKAPVGYEDELGFHIIRQVKGSAVTRYARAEETSAASLKGARVYP